MQNQTRSERIVQPSDDTEQHIATTMQMNFTVARACEEAKRSNAATQQVIEQSCKLLATWRK